jgi:hypothetical protein
VVVDLGQTRVHLLRLATPLAEQGMEGMDTTSFNEVVASSHLEVCVFYVVLLLAGRGGEGRR